MLLAGMMALSGGIKENAPVEGGGGGSGAPQVQALPPPPPAPVHVQPPAQAVGNQNVDYRKKFEEAEAARLEVEKTLADQRTASLSEMDRLRQDMLRAQDATRHQVETLVRDQQELAARTRMANLAAYRADLLRQFGEDRLPSFLHPQVTGADEHEVYQSATRVATSYLAHRTALETQFMARTPPVPPQGPVQGVHQPQSPFQPVSGFPTPVAGFAPPQAPSLDVAGLTSEQAVRTGKYQEHKTAILDAIKRGQNPATLQVPPPQQAPQGYPQYIEQFPGQFQPQGLAPAQQVRPQHMSAPSQPLPPAPVVVGPDGGIQSSVDPVAAARASIARTNQGLNPLVSQDPAAASQHARLAASQFAGQDPTAAFQQRFSPTPPLPTGTQG